MEKCILEGIVKTGRKKVLFVLLFVAVAVFGVHKINAREMVFVDADASGSMDGSDEHPFNNIQDAIDKASEKDRDVFVANGYYKESLKLWSDVKLMGEDRGSVVIEADDDEYVVTMYDDSEIHNLYLTDGKSGVYVKTGAKALVANCDIVDNNGDGIKAGAAKTHNDQKLEVYDSYIAKNGKNGMYIGQRKVYMSGNLVEKNEKDGIEIARGSEGIIKNIRVKDNDGDGLKVYLDRSDLKIDSLTVRDNGREGVEVRAHGIEGFVHIEDCKFNDNDNWAIARVEATSFTDAQWERNLLIEHPTFVKNGIGAISNYVVVYAW